MTREPRGLLDTFNPDDFAHITRLDLRTPQRL